VTRKKITEKKSRKDDLDPNKDQFLEKSISILDWAVERRKQIGVLLLVALVAAIAGVTVDHLSRKGAADASAVIATGLEAYLAPVIVVPEGEEAPKKEDLLYFDTREARANEALKRFDEAVQKEKGSSIGDMALLGKAGADFDLGKYDEAIAAYRGFLEGVDSETSWLAPNAREGLGHAYEAAGKTDEAREVFAEMAEKETGRVALMGLFHEARMFEAKGDRNRAGALYEKVVKAIAEDGDFDRLDYLFSGARERLLQINPEADVPSLPGGGMDGFDPAMLEQFLRAQQAAGGDLQ